MTPETINTLTPTVLAALAALGGALTYINLHVMPQVKDLYTAIRDLHEGHALNTQQIETQTARLNGQSAKIDALKDVVTLTPADPMPLVTAISGIIHATQDKTAEMQQKTTEMNRQTLLDGIKAITPGPATPPPVSATTDTPPPNFVDGQLEPDANVSESADSKPAGTEGD